MSRLMTSVCVLMSSLWVILSCLHCGLLFINVYVWSHRHSCQRVTFSSPDLLTYDIQTSHQNMAVLSPSLLRTDFDQLVCVKAERDALVSNLRSLEFFKVELHLMSVWDVQLCNSTDYIFRKQAAASCKQTTFDFNKWDRFAFCTYFTDQSQGVCQYLAVNNHPVPYRALRVHLEKRTVWKLYQAELNPSPKQTHWPPEPLEQRTAVYIIRSITEIR